MFCIDKTIKAIVICIGIFYGAARGGIGLVLRGFNEVNRWRFRRPDSFLSLL